MVLVGVDGTACQYDFVLFCTLDLFLNMSKKHLLSLDDQLLTNTDKKSLYQYEYNSRRKGNISIQAADLPGACQLDICRSSIALEGIRGDVVS